VRRRALPWLVVAGCSFPGGNTNQGDVDAPPIIDLIDGMPMIPDAPPGAPDMRMTPDAMPPPPPDAMPVADCGPGYQSITNGLPLGATYRGVNNGNEWNDARADCQSDGAELVVIDNTAEAQAVAALVNDPKSPYFWIGIFDPAGGGDNNWLTVHGAAPSFLDFGPQQPTGGNQDCMLVGDGSPYEMYDFDCIGFQYYVCECLP
jgi:hypothetical protein